LTTVPSASLPEGLGGRRFWRYLFMHIVIELMRMSIIKGDKVSFDCSIIWAWLRTASGATVQSITIGSAGAIRAGTETHHGYGITIESSMCMGTRCI
ncbi:MAG: hypothetical protein QW769_02070, partial [Nitrososphaerales archaeon]